MDRIEVIKGSSSIIFGLVRLGGVVNYITRKPELESQGGDIRLNLRQLGFCRSRTQLQLRRQRNSPRTASGAGGIDADGWRDNDFKREHYLGGAFLWRVSGSAQVSLDSSKRSVARTRTANPPPSCAATPATSSIPPSPSRRRAPRLAQRQRLRQRADVRYLRPPCFLRAIPTAARSRWAAKRILPPSINPTPRISNTCRRSATASSTSSRGQRRDRRLRDPPLDQRHLEPFADGTVRFRFGNFANYRNSYNLDNKFLYRLLGGTNHTLSLGQEWQRVRRGHAGLVRHPRPLPGRPLRCVRHVESAHRPAPQRRPGTRRQLRDMGHLAPPRRDRRRLLHRTELRLLRRPPARARRRATTRIHTTPTTSAPSPTPKSPRRARTPPRRSTARCSSNT